MKTDNLLKLIRADLRDFVPFSSARDEASNGQIWLNANESPYECTTFNGIINNRYPQKQPKNVIATLAKLYHVNESEIALSRGSDEAIDLLIRLFCSAYKDAVMISPPTFAIYSVYAHLQAAMLIETPLGANFKLDLESVFSNWIPAVKIIFLCSPNNPSGNLLNENDIIACCERFAGKSIIVADEAYIEYTDSKSLSRYINQYSNLVVLRTLSKAYGLAGERAGVLIANKQIVDWIIKIMCPYPTPKSTAENIILRLQPKQLEIVQQQIAVTKSERIRLFDKLQTLSAVKKIWPSDANFFLIKTANADETMKTFADAGIIIRNMHGKLNLDHCVRITIGTPEENNKVITVFEKMSD